MYIKSLKKLYLNLLHVFQVRKIVSFIEHKGREGDFRLQSVNHPAGASFMADGNVKVKSYKIKFESKTKQSF